MSKNRARGGVLQAVGAFVFGAASGSLLALLYAPASGNVTRRRLALRARTLQQSCVRQIGQTQRTLARKAERARVAAAGWITDHMPLGNGRHPIRRRTARHATVH